MKTNLLCALAAVSISACGVDDGVGEPVILDSERLSANGMTPSDLSATSIGVAKLTTSYVNAMSSTYAGRNVLQYLVGCALSSGNNITATYTIGSQQYQITYQGHVGLFNSWKTTTPTIGNQRAISGCVLARMNETGAYVLVSIRGSAYPNDAGEINDYTVREGAFFGNVFDGSDTYWGSCDYAGAEPLTTRQCAQDGHCSMSWAGDCATACTMSGGGDYYSSCTANGVNWPVGTVYLNEFDYE